MHCRYMIGASRGTGHANRRSGAREAAPALLSAGARRCRAGADLRRGGGRLARASRQARRVLVVGDADQRPLQGQPRRGACGAQDAHHPRTVRPLVGVVGRNHRRGAGAAGRAQAEFARSLRWIVGTAVGMIPLALWYVSLFGALTTHAIIATTLGVSISVLLGSGLFAAAFFSAPSGHDQTVTDATRGNGPGFNPAALPAGLLPYRRTASFSETSVPAALRADHDTKAGRWGLIHVTEGRLRCRVADPRRAPLDLVLTPDEPPCVVEPTIRHQVEPLGAVRFHVEFWRAAPEQAVKA